jgi:DNA-directed RNA polymerase specialized sigma24 family protein
MARRARASGGGPPPPVRAGGATITVAPDVHEMAAAVVTAERMRAALDVLPEEQRTAIQLASFGGRTYRDVARVLGVPEGTAKAAPALATL